jgi:ABC-type transport system substrate-binding protein
MNSQEQRWDAISRRKALALASGAVLAGALPSGAFGQGTPRRGGVLKVSAMTNPSTLDPATGGSGTDHIFLYTLYDTLVEWDYGTLQTKPGLAESWSNPDPTTLVLNLRSGVLFHDGTPLDAEAVRFNLDRNKTDPRSNLKADLISLASVAVTGPLQVTLKLSSPDSALPAILSDRAGMMVSPTALKQDSNLDRKPVGAGAYRFVRWTDGDRLVVVRNEQYWRPNRPFLDGIEFAIIPELSTGLRSVAAGENSFVYSLSSRQKVVVDRNKTLRSVIGPSVYCIQFYLNWARKPFDDIRIRRAFNYAVDREAFVNAALAGTGEAAYMNLPKAHWAFDPEVAKMYPYDQAKARSLLAEAGASNLTIDVGGYNDQDSVQREEILLEQFRKVGVTLRFQNAPIAEVASGFFGPEKRVPSIFSAWTGRPDPSLTYSLMYSQDAYYNAGRAPIPPELADAIKASRAVDGLEARKAAFAKVQRLVMDNALVVPIAFQYEFDAMSQTVMDYKPNLLGKPKFENVWLAS